MKTSEVYLRILAVKCSGGMAMLWVWFSSAGTRELVLVDVKMSEALFSAVLKENLLEAGKKLTTKTQVQIPAMRSKHVQVLVQFSQCLDLNSVYN